MKIISSREELNIFFGKINSYFSPVKKRPFLKHKNAYFLKLFPQTEEAHLCNYSKVLTN